MAEIYNQEFQPVTVDAGDLSEAIHATQAWAAVLRTRADLVRLEFNDQQIPDEDKKRYMAAAERIEATAARLRKQSYESGLQK
jgi:DNA polymerase III delta prime subunit